MITELTCHSICTSGVTDLPILINYSLPSTTVVSWWRIEIEAEWSMDLHPNIAAISENAIVFI